METHFTIRTLTILQRSNGNSRPRLRVICIVIRCISDSPVIRRWAWEILSAFLIVGLYTRPRRISRDVGSSSCTMTLPSGRDSGARRARKSLQMQLAFVALFDARPAERASSMGLTLSRGRTRTRDLSRSVRIDRQWEEGSRVVVGERNDCWTSITLDYVIPIVGRRRIALLHYSTWMIHPFQLQGENALLTNKCIIFKPWVSIDLRPDNAFYLLLSVTQFYQKSSATDCFGRWSDRAEKSLSSSTILGSVITL